MRSNTSGKRGGLTLWCVLALGVGGCAHEQQRSPDQTAYVNPRDVAFYDESGSLVSSVGRVAVGT